MHHTNSGNGPSGIAVGAEFVWSLGLNLHNSHKMRYQKLGSKVVFVLHKYLKWLVAR